MLSWHRLLAAAVLAAGLADREAIGFAPPANLHRSHPQPQRHPPSFAGPRHRRRGGGGGIEPATRLRFSVADALLSLDLGAASDGFGAVASSARHFLEPVVVVEHDVAAKSALFLGRHPVLWHDLNALSDGAHRAWEAYGDALRDHPLATKAATASTLAVAGDAVAQFSAMPSPSSSSSSSSSSGGQSSGYDLRRAVSFGIFAALYTGSFQHFWFGWLNSHLAFEASLRSPAMAVLLASPASPGVLAALKVGLNQFAMVPLVYMPLFFALTGAAGGLSPGESWERARGLFLPLLTRNYAFWLPAQLVQFALVPPEFQITYLCAAGLFWNVILSTASSGAGASSAPQEEASVALEAVSATSAPELLYAEDAVTLSDVGDALADGAGEVAGAAVGALAHAAEDALVEAGHALADGALVAGALAHAAEDALGGGDAPSGQGVVLIEDAAAGVVDAAPIEAKS